MGEGGGMNFIYKALQAKDVKICSEMGNQYEVLSKDVTWSNTRFEDNHAAGLRIHWDRNEKGKDDDGKERNYIVKYQFKNHQEHHQESQPIIILV